MSLKLISHDKYLAEIQKPGAVLVASPTKVFTDDEKGSCAECGCDIYYRPYSKKAVKKICPTCGQKYTEKERILSVSDQVFGEDAVPLNESIAG